jgi:hypothetical protein
MKEIIVLTVITGLTFLVFGLFLLFGIFRRDKKLLLNSAFVFLVFLGFAGWTGFEFVTKFYNKVADTLKPRNGDEIYDALFGKRQTECVKVLNHQDQVVPKIDYAIWLHFETCPKELKRILSRHEFSGGKVATNGWDGKIPFGETLDWFKPTTLGDIILVYEYSTENSRNIQTIWASVDSTKVFCRDILD